MTEQQAKEKGYTHHGKLYGVPVYITDDEDMNVIGTNWFNDRLVSIFILLDMTFEINECFCIQKGSRL